MGIACLRVGEALDPPGETGQEHARAAVARTGRTAQVLEAAKPKSQVPVWREGLAWSVLSVDYQRILQAVGDRGLLGQGPPTCQAAVRSPVSARDRHAQEQAARVDDVPLAPVDQLAAVEAAAVRSDDGVRLDALRVDQLGRAGRVRAAGPGRPPCCGRHPQSQRLD